jgi:hypothetical protein
MALACSVSGHALPTTTVSHGDGCEQAAADVAWKLRVANSRESARSGSRSGCSAQSASQPDEACGAERSGVVGAGVRGLVASPPKFLYGKGTLTSGVRMHRGGLYVGCAWMGRERNDALYARVLRARGARAIVQAALVHAGRALCCSLAPSPPCVWCAGRVASWAIPQAERVPLSPACQPIPSAPIEPAFRGKAPRIEHSRTCPCDQVGLAGVRVHAHDGTVGGFRKPLGTAVRSPAGAITLNDARHAYRRTGRRAIPGL